MARVVPTAIWPADRRDDIVATLIVGAVVIVLGYASGIGAARPPTDYLAPESPPAQAMPEPVIPQPIPQHLVTGTSGHSGMHTMLLSLPPGFAAMLAEHASHQKSAGEPATPGDEQDHGQHGSGEEGTDPGDGDSPGLGCVLPAGTVGGVSDPLVDHLYEAHLEQSPSEQVGDALHTDAYLASHLVLLGTMLEPATDRGEDAPLSPATCPAPGPATASTATPSPTPTGTPSPTPTAAAE